jgi:hypothetical protein
MLVSFTNSATDADFPANTQNYSLAPGAPAGAVVSASSGVFAWQTSDLDVGSSNHITVHVTDNGLPPLDDAQSFSLLVQPRPAIASAGVVGPDFQLQWSAIPGVKYRVQFKNQLEDVSWSDLLPEVTASGGAAGFSLTVTNAQQFFRVSVVAP